jgi:hypothetical protein
LIHIRSLQSRYLVGVHNKRTGITTLRAAPLHILTHRVKALKGMDPTPVSAQERLQARATLGEAFGTKKAKANIRAQERNKVDVSAMEGVVGHLQDRIEQSTGALPTQGRLHDHVESRKTTQYPHSLLQRKQKRRPIAIVSFRHTISTLRFLGTCIHCTTSYPRRNGKHSPSPPSLLHQATGTGLPYCLTHGLTG